MATITVTTEHMCEIVERVLPFRGRSDHRPVFKMVLVSPADDGLRWIATDSYRMGCLYRGAADLSRPVTVPSDLVEFAARHALRGELETVTFEVDDDAGTVTLVQPELHVPRALSRLDYPNVDAQLFAVPEQQPIILRVGGENLRAAIHATVTFAGSEEDPAGHPVALRSDGEVLEVLTRWPDTPDVLAFIPASTDGPVETVVNATFLQSLVDAAGARDLELLVGAASEPLRLRTEDGFYGLLMPLRVGQTELEQRIADYLRIGPAELRIGPGTSIALSFGGSDIVVRHLEGGDPFGRDDLASFSVVLATDVASTPDLLYELNEVNVRARLCRLTHADGTVRAIADTPLATLGDDGIDTVCAELLRQQREVGPLVRGLFQPPGGSSRDD